MIDRNIQEFFYGIHCHRWSTKSIGMVNFICRPVSNDIDIGISSNTHHRRLVILWADGRNHHGIRTALFDSA